MQSAPGTAPATRLMDLLIPRDADAAAVAEPAAAGARMLWEPFVEVALADPDRLAIAGAQSSVPYGRLLESARGVAGSLRAAGADQTAPVAVFVEKGWEQIAAALGVQLGGAAYLAVPTDWPSRRIADLIRHAGVRIAVVAAEEAAPVLPSGLTVMNLHSAGPPATLDEIRRHRNPGDLAYVIPTSGTTGVPKAVMVEHRAAWNTIDAINRMFGVGEHDRVLGLSALGFDLSVYDIFGVLGAGGAVVLPARERTRDPQHWIDLCRAWGVTVWNSVPAFARMMAEGGVPRGETLARCSSLRLMMLSGDWIPLTLARRIRQERPDIELISLGGATEASIWSIYHRVDQVEDSWKSVPYGRALPGQSIAVLDESLETVPPWTEGEIYIGGAGLARGYWGADALTRERFVTHPRTGERLYRTGDLGRVWPDGTVELLGRIDTQVKISGHRVELGEIESHLQDLAGVRAAAVTHRSIGAAERKELVAYVVLAETTPQGPITDPIERLRFTLQEHGVRRFSGEVRTTPLAVPADDTFAAAFRARRTHRTFRPEPVTWDSLNALLGHLAQLRLEGYPLPKHLYPSAGSLYPVQVYLHVRAGRVAGLEAGAYYVDPRAPRLCALTDGQDLPTGRFGELNVRAAEQAAFSLFLVGALPAIAPMYPDQARDFCLLEAGYIGQLLMASAPAAGLGLCPIGGIDGDEWRTLLQLDESHVFLHAFIGGIPADDGRADRERAERPSGSDLQRLFDEPGLGQGRDAAAARELRRQLETRLPAHMIPGAWIILDALPLTENGKVDRKSLPEPAPADAGDVPDGETTPTEARLLALWQQFLGGRTIALDQGFFEAGGDSLLLLDIQGMLQQEFGIEVPLAHLFQYPTIRSLAAWLDRALAEGDGLPEAGA